MRIIHHKEMIEYILSQPPEKLVDFSENTSDSECGCLMVQFGKDNNLVFTDVGFATWSYHPVKGSPLSNKLVAKFESPYEYNCYCYSFEMNNGPIPYSVLQKYCQQHYPEICNAIKT